MLDRETLRRTLQTAHAPEDLAGRGILGVRIGQASGLAEPLERSQHHRHVERPFICTPVAMAGVLSLVDREARCSSRSRGELLEAIRQNSKECPGA